jgi:uncharacterized protein (TIGR02147 family)
MIEVYEYFDYRKLLKDLYKDRKNKNPNFSYRYLGRKAGFKSAGYFTNVLKGKCNISTTVAFKLAEVFKLKKQEMEYLELLVLYETAPTQEEKRHYFEKIISQKKSKLKKLDKGQYEFFSHWYYLAIREILNFHVFKGDNYKSLARMCNPPITTKEAKQAVETLESLGMIRKNPYGYYEQVDSILTTGEEWHSMAITNFQHETMDLAKHALDRINRKHRDISTLTLSISDEELKVIKQKLSKVQREILEVAKNARNSDLVYQLNFQVFPLSKVEPE